MDKIIEYGIIAGVAFLIWITYLLTRKRVANRVARLQMVVGTDEYF